MLRESSQGEFEIVSSIVQRTSYHLNLEIAINGASSYPQCEKEFFDREGFITLLQRINTSTKCRLKTNELIERLGLNSLVNIR